MIPAHYLRTLILGAGLLVWPLLALSVLGVAGCGRSQMQDLSDAKAGAVAYQQESNPAKRAQIADGVMGHLLAALDQYPLQPPPKATPVEIRADPGAYTAAGARAQADPKPYVAPPAPDHGSGPLDDLRAWGATFRRWGFLVGGIGGALALLLWAYSRWGWTWGGWAMRLLLSPVISPLVRIAALWGSASAAIGVALSWLADWWWALALVGLAVGGVVAWVHWNDVRRWWRKRRAVQP